MVMALKLVLALTVTTLILCEAKSTIHQLSSRTFEEDPDSNTDEDAKSLTWEDIMADIFEKEIINNSEKSNYLQTLLANVNKNQQNASKNNNHNVNYNKNTNNYLNNGK